MLGSNGGGRTSDVIEAIEFAIANRSRLKIEVSISLGDPIYESRETDPLVQVVEAAVRAGIVVVTSAGNFGTNPETGLSGYAGITSPGNAPSAITLAPSILGTRRRGWTTGSRRPARAARPGSTAPPGLTSRARPPARGRSGPAQRTLLQRPTGRVLGRDKRPRYLMLSGTSMAAAVTSGVVALI